MGSAESLSLRMRTAVTLQCLFLMAVASALAVTIAETSSAVGLLASILVVPIIVLAAVCICLCLQRNIWGFAGAAVLGGTGVGLRLAVSTQPGLEVGGGLPIWLSALYVLLGALVAIWSVGSMLEMRSRSAPR
jgi:hypothetical protein